MAVITAIKVIKLDPSIHPTIPTDARGTKRIACPPPARSVDGWVAVSLKGPSISDVCTIFGILELLPLPSAFHAT